MKRDGVFGQVVPAPGMMRPLLLGSVENLSASFEVGEHEPEPRAGGMTVEERLELFRNALAQLFANPGRDSFVVFQVEGDPDGYVQFRFHDDGLYGEVGSRQWNTVGFATTNARSVVEGLASLGFTGGGPRHNFSRTAIDADEAAVAELTEQLFRTAYQEPADYVVRAQLSDRPQPNGSDVVALSDELIQRYLDGNELKYARGDSGSFDIQRFYEPSLGRGLMVHIACRGEKRSVLEVMVVPDRTTPRPRWGDVIDACNQWNLMRRWPKVYLREITLDSGAPAGVIHAEASIDLEAGIHPALLTAWLDRMVGSAFEFWNWMTNEKGL